MVNGFLQVSITCALKYFRSAFDIGYILGKKEPKVLFVFRCCIYKYIHRLLK